MKALFALILVGALKVVAEMPSLPLNSSVQANAYQPSFSPESIAIAQKFQAAVQANREWFLAYVKEQEAHLKPGDIMPYHEKFGVTNEEYESFAKTASKPKLELVGQRQLQFSAAENKTTISIEGLSPLIGTIVVDAQHQRAQCVLGSQTAKAVQVTSEGGVLGAWRGVTFDYPSNGAAVSHGKFSIGKTAKGDRFLYVDFRLLTAGEWTEVIMIYRWEETASASASPPKSNSARD